MVKETENGPINCPKFNHPSRIWHEDTEGHLEASMLKGNHVPLHS